jgi:hypothetical protein
MNKSKSLGQFARGLRRFWNKLYTIMGQFFARGGGGHELLKKLPSYMVILTREV